MKHSALFLLGLVSACAAAPSAVVRDGHDLDRGHLAASAEPDNRAAPSSGGAVSLSAYRTASAEEVASVVASSNAFATDLYAALRGETSGNWAASPTSIALALAMTHGGARASTREQVRNALHLSLDDEAAHRAYGTLLRQWNGDGERPYELRVANRLFGEKSLSFLESFKTLTADHYVAELEDMDFLRSPESSRRRINAWVQNQTNDRILDLLPEDSIDEATKLVLANAIYFKGKWATEFSEEATRPGSFYATSGQRQVEMMRRMSSFAHAQIERVQLLEMPYQGGDLAMTVLLPDARHGIADLEKRLTPSNLEKWLKSMAQREVIVTLPKFRVDPPEPLSLNHTLAALGIVDAFVPRLADFSGISEEASKYRLHITDAVHKAFVEVNEEGTEAAAATGIVIGAETTSIRPEPVRFTADHPFVFLIRDVKSGAILFMGRVADPTAKEPPAGTHREPPKARPS